MLVPVHIGHKPIVLLSVCAGEVLIFLMRGNYKKYAALFVTNYLWCRLKL